MTENIVTGLKSIMGSDEATIDDKGRILVSKKKRERLGDDFVVALGLVGVVTAFPAHSWERLEKVIIGGEDVINHGRDMFSRTIMGTAEDELKFDIQGRIVIPRKLRELGKLTKDVCIVGAGDRLEFWDAQEYAIYLQDENAYGIKRRDMLASALIQMSGKMA